MYRIIGKLPEWLNILSANALVRQHLGCEPIEIFLVRPGHDLLDPACDIRVGIALDLIPIVLEQQLFDPVGVEHLVVEKMPEHYEHRITIERLVHGRFLPLFLR